MCVLLSLEPRDSHRLALGNKNKGREGGRDGGIGKLEGWHLHWACVRIQTEVVLFKLEARKQR